MTKNRAGGKGSCPEFGFHLDSGRSPSIISGTELPRSAYIEKLDNSVRK